MGGVEVEIQFQDVHARFPKQSQIPPLGMPFDKRAYVFFSHAAFARNTRQLEFSGGRRDLGVEA